MRASGSAMLLQFGIMHHRAGRFADAIDCYRAVLALEPDRAEARQLLGEALAGAGRTEDAIASYRAAVALDPRLGGSWNNLGMALVEQSRLDEAFTCYQRALALWPDAAGIHNNLGIALRAQSRTDEAIASFHTALALQPDYAEAHFNLGKVLAERNRRDEAIASFTRALELKPNYTVAFIERVVQRWQICDWSEHDAERARLLTLLHQGELISPFLLRAAGATPAEMLAAARRASDAVQRPEGVGFAHTPREREKGRPWARLRIGYLSSDFCRHPVALLAAELFERHDRAAFEVFGYSHGPDDGSDVRRRLARAFEHFVDIRTLSDAEAARRIRADGIDILVDLNGLTDGGRPAILAARPAPVQATWLGYIGTAGADFIDDVIADPFAVPATQQPFYSERIVHLPHCYLPLDNTREIAAETPSRREFGLPEAGFVFCNFSNSYKIAPEMFGFWMRVLSRTPGSVLWLYAAHPSVSANLKREAAARGVDPERLVFAASIPLPDYLARFRRADLFLDTLPCSACTTGADALWAGLPLLTCAGEIFAGRHGGSLLLAAGLSELATSSLAEYEALAVRLATEPGLLAELRQRLERNRATAPLFDTARFARDLEAVYRRMAAQAFEPAAVNDR